MAIWIDLANSPHVTFMRPFVERFREDRVPFFITARDYGNTIELLGQERWLYEEVGGHGGKKVLGKLWSFGTRLLELRKALRRVRPKVAFSQSSFYSPLVARSLGVPFVYTNDNEYARGNLAARISGGVAMYPRALCDSKDARLFLGSNSVFYDGVKEGIYLSQRPAIPSLALARSVYYYRPEPWLAQYHEADPEFSLRIIGALERLGSVRIIARDVKQREYYSRKLSGHGKVEVLPTVVTLDDIVKTGAAFVGSGGTMCRELALLGVPTVSLYSGKLLAVDCELIERGLMLHTQDPERLKAFLESAAVNEQCAREAEKLLEDGRRTFELICEKLYGFL